MLKTSRLLLRPLDEKDADGPYPTWFNDPEVCAGNSHGNKAYSRADALSYIRGTSNDPTRLVLAITLQDSGSHVGNISLQHIDLDSGKAELAIIIGDKSCWGKGVGYEACRAIIDHGFNSINLRQIYCGTYSNNAPMIALALRLGFSEVAVSKEAVTKNGVRLDVHLFELKRNQLA